MTPILEKQLQINEEQAPFDEEEPIRQWSPSAAVIIKKPNINPAIREWALQQIKYDVLHNPDLRRVYLFPSEEQMRVLYVEASNPPVREGDEIAPYYLPAHPELGAPFATGMTTIRPEEAEMLPPPYCWADWSEAEILWEDDRENAA